MEKSILVADDHPSNESTPASLSAGSLIKINSISIDLLNANDKSTDAEKCEHFSIRGYVSEIRKRNEKICWPFSLHVNDDKSEGPTTCLLPPLDVPKFRWWGCKSCLQDISAGSASKEDEVGSYPFPSGFKSSGTCSHGAVMLPPDNQRAPNKPKFTYRGKFDARTSADINNMDHSSLRGDEKEQESEIACNTFIGCENGLNDDMNKLEKHTNGTVTPRSKCNGPVEVPNNASSDSDDIKSHGAPRRKFRKVRLLAELLGEYGVASSKCRRTADSRPNAVSEVSSRQGTASVVQGPVAVQGGNAKRGFMGQNRKRQLPQDEEWRPPEMSSPNNVNKSIKVVDDAETESESEDAFVGVDLQMGLKTNLGKRQHRTTQIIDLNESQCEIGDSSEGDATNGGLLSSAQDAFRERGNDTCHLRDQRMKRKSNVCENKNKMPEVDDERASLVPLHNATPIAGPTARKDVEFMRTEILTVPVQSAQQASTGKGLEFSLNNYLTVPRYDKIYSPQVEGELHSSLPWHKDSNQSKKKGIEPKFIGDSRLLPKSAMSGIYGAGVHGEHSRKEIIYKMPFLNDMHKHTSQVEVGVGSKMQKMAFSNSSNNGKTFEDEKHSTITKKRSGRRADNISEQGTLDDTTMEIVELMAKNQYERCLQDAERETMNNRSTQIVDFTEVYGNRGFRSPQEEATRKQKHQDKNGRNGVRTTKGDNIGPNKQNVDYFSHVNRSSQFKQTHGLTGFHTFSQFHENPNSEAQFHAASSSGHRSVQNCLVNGGDRVRLGLRPSNSNMQCLSACNTCQTLPQQSKEAAGLWSSIIPNHSPFGFNISQKCEAQSPSVDMLSCHPSNLHKRNMNEDHAMNFLNASVANLGQHHKNFGSDTLSRTNPDYPFACKHGTELPKKMAGGSLDLYSNETIPAMHLLSLMDAGVRSGAAVSVEETQKLLRKPVFTQDPHSRDYSTQLGVSHELFPPIRTGGASTSFQQNRSVRRVNNITGQISLKGKTKIDENSTQHGGQKSGRNNRGGAVFLNNSGERFLGESHPPLFPFHSHVIGNSLGKQKIDAHATNGHVWPQKSNLKTEICGVNKNPADFSVPGARNVYMIRGEDLKFRKSVPSDDGGAHNKRRKNAKLIAAKERVRQRIP